MIKLTLNGKEIEVKERLTLEESMRFVNYVKEEVVVDGYTPLLHSLSIATNFMRLYTNIDEVSVDEFYRDLAKYKEFISSITNNVQFDKMQYEEILNSIYQEIEFEKEKLSNISKLDELLETVNGILKDFSASFDLGDMEKILPKLASMKNFDQSEMIKQVLGSLKKDGE